MKNETKHTPGPWQAEWTHRQQEGQEKGWHVFSEAKDNDGDLDCEAHGPICEFDDNRPNNAANARLIAAAPELLEACKLAQRNLKAVYPEAHYLMKQLEKAIKKAEGGPK